MKNKYYDPKQIKPNKVLKFKIHGSSYRFDERNKINAIRQKRGKR